MQQNSYTFQENYRYGILLSIIYGFVWFIDLLDASTLNVALPALAQAFSISPTEAEWAIIGFLLTMTIGMSISNWLADNFGTKTIFILAQALYIGSSIGCGFAQTILQLDAFRALQGFSGGMAIPIGMAALMRVMPRSKWAKTSSYMNMVTLIAPAMGPIFAGYVTGSLGWRWIFFLKLPLSFICLYLSIYWIRKDPKTETSKFDWLGFVLSSLSLTLILYVFSEIGKTEGSYLFLIGLLILGILSGMLFIRVEKKAVSPLIPLAIFRFPHFSFGNLIQSAANTIFLGANFIIALYLQRGLGLDIVTTGWVMSAITPGMILTLPLVGKFYNKIGPLPFMLPGLVLLGLSTMAFAFVSSTTSPFILALLVFFEGAASSMVQTANVTSIFSGIPHKHKTTGSTLYSLFKQISASFGVALSAMVLSIGMKSKGLSLVSSEIHPGQLLGPFHICFIVLGAIPLFAISFCYYINNKQALKETQTPDHLHTEAEYGAE